MKPSKELCLHTEIEWDDTAPILDSLPQQQSGKCIRCGLEQVFSRSKKRRAQLASEKAGLVPKERSQ